MKRIIIAFLLLLVSDISNGQSNQGLKIEFDVSCGYAGITSNNIYNIQRLIKSKSYFLIKQKLYGENKSEAILSVIAIRELQSIKHITISQDDISQIDSISNWLDKYSVCYTCTEQFEGTTKELLAKKQDRVYHLLKGILFNKN